jgi:hypothetical protein
MIEPNVPTALDRFIRVLCGHLGSTIEAERAHLDRADAKTLLLGDGKQVLASRNVELNRSVAVQTCCGDSIDESRLTEQRR